MTTLVVWVGIDSRSIASVYAASDSRISWSDKNPWDEAQKVFATLKHPDIFAFCGSSDFPLQILAKLISLIDGGHVFKTGEDYVARALNVEQILIKEHLIFPNKQEFWIVHCMREGSGMQSMFFAKLLHWNSKKWEIEWLKIPNKSDVVIALGSGNLSFAKWRERWENVQLVKGTSRSVFGAFCDGLASGQDSFSGGPPQLVGIYRIAPARVIGTIYKNERFILGSRVNDSPHLGNWEWRNSLFERCDPRSLERLEDAQTHQHLKGLGKSLP